MRVTCDLCGRRISANYVRLGKYRVHKQCAQKFIQLALSVFHFESAESRKTMEKLKKLQKLLSGEAKAVRVTIKL